MKKQVEIDLKKIFLTPPNTRMEKITLLVMMVVVFVMFFGPICFSAGLSAHPVHLLGLDRAAPLAVSEI